MPEDQQARFVGAGPTASTKLSAGIRLNYDGKPGATRTTLIVRRDGVWCVDMMI
ncbi:MAG: hypothetical protein DIU77_004665 [Thermocrispum agreste]|uniref:Uncharacterized protein n=1 Tax=Thermocrispum agreste TaxID=37925 RepID=A0ABD6FDS4_9PSEU